MRLVFGDNGNFQVRTDERTEHDPASAWATVMLAGPNGEIEHMAAEGNGPVNALDTALRRALSRFYPEVAEVRLYDYKVRVLGGAGGSAATVACDRSARARALGNGWRTHRSEESCRHSSTASVQDLQSESRRSPRRER